MTEKEHKDDCGGIFFNYIQFVVNLILGPRFKIYLGFDKLVFRKLIIKLNSRRRGVLPRAQHMTSVALSENLFQVSLTQEQAKVIAKRMPLGYCVNLLRSSKRDATKSRIQQELSSEEEPRQKKRVPVENFKSNQNEELKRCLTVLHKLKKHALAGPFMRKLDDVYYPQNQEYMDLGIVEENLKNSTFKFYKDVYISANQFLGDVRKIWQMSYTMNTKGSQVYAMTSQIEQYFNDIFKEVEQPFLAQPVLQKQSSSVVNKRSQNPNVSNYPNPPVKKAVKPAPVQRLETPMNMQEKKQLVLNIRNLPLEHLRGVWEIVSDGMTIQNQNEELQFDIDTLPVKKTRQLERYVNMKMKVQKKPDDMQLERTDNIIHQDNKKYNYVPPPIAPRGTGDDSQDSSFSSDEEESR